MEEQRKTEVRALKSKNVELQTRLTTYEEQDDNLKKFGKEKAALEDQNAELQANLKTEQADRFAEC